MIYAPGPFAFPLAEKSNGMLLRDYFAAAAMQGLLAKYTIKAPEDQTTITQLCFELADEMLKQRNE